MKRFLYRVVALIVLASGIAAGAFFYFMSYSPDRSLYPVRGIDASNHQGAIDWQRVAADDVAFVILKATEGGDFVDKSFARNVEAAREAGLLVGAYHFFTLCRSGVEQAANFVSTVPKDAPLLPPVVDIEFGGNCKERPSPDEFRAELAAYLDRVEMAFGQPAIVYVIGEAVEVYGEAIPDRRRWVRSLAMHPGHNDWTYWQYHNKGRVEGISGDVDLNVFRGERAMLDALAVQPRK